MIISQPHFNADFLEYFSKRIVDSSIYLEYGCGGSTIMALSCGGPSKVISVENDCKYLNAVKNQCRAQDLSKATFLHVDLGPTKAWGVPDDSRNLTNAYKYPQSPWNEMKKDAIQPDLILIDGRFRAACFLTCLILGNPNTEILVDDFKNRPALHLILKYCQVDQWFGESARFYLPELDAYALKEVALDLARKTAHP